MPGPSLPTRFFHSTDVPLAVGGLLLPAASTGTRSDSVHCAGYSAELAYMWDPRIIAHSPDPSGWHIYAEAEHIYQVRPLGAVNADPEGGALDAAYLASHRHAPAGAPASVPGCQQCLEEDLSGDYGAAEWYHAYLWVTSHALVVAELDEDAYCDMAESVSAPLTRAA